MTKESAKPKAKPKKEKEVITLTLPEYVLRGFGSKGKPQEVELRDYLNKEGFKFKDDGKLSSVTNLNPEPLGEMKVEKDLKKRTTTFTQTI